jgi:hypothetical protein
MQFKFPQTTLWFPSFKTHTCMLDREDQLLPTPLQLKPVQTFSEGIGGCYTSYYSRGTLYYCDGFFPSSLAVVELA